MKLTGPLKWHGGKMYLADWIISHFPPHLHYVEPFFGGGAVLLHRDTKRDWFIDPAWKLANGEKVPPHLKGCSEVVNDKNERLIHFWNVLADPGDFAEFSRIVQATPFCQCEWARSEFAWWRGESRADTAARFFIRARQSMSGRMKSFAPLSKSRTRGGRNEQANAWLGCIDGLPEVHARLQGVVILNDDACKVIRQQDSDKTLFYCDPPYLHETRATTGEYECEMSDSQHRELLETLAAIKGKFLLSGYPSAMYDDFAKSRDWNRHEKLIDNKSSSAKSKEKKTECLWANF